MMESDGRAWLYRSKLLSIFHGRSPQALHRLLLTIVPYRWHILAAFAGMALIAATEPAFVWVIKHLVDNGFQGAYAGGGLLWILLALVLVFAVRGIAAFVTGYLMIWVSSAALARLQRQVYEAMLKSDPLLDDVYLGQTVNSVVVEARNAFELVERVIIKFFRSLFSVLALAFTMFQIAPLLALGLMTFAIPFVWAVRTTGRRYEHAANGYVLSTSRLAECTEEVLAHADLIRDHDTTEPEARRLDLIGERVNLAYRRMLSIAGMMVPLTQAIVACYVAALLWLRSVLADALTDGEFVALSATLLLMMVPLRDLAEVNGAMLRGLVATLTIFSSTDLPREADGAAVLADGGAPTIRFDNVSVRYPDALSSTLQHVSLLISPGQVVALTGPCGSGKTTLLDLVSGLVRASYGSVTLDGICVDELDRHALRQNIAHIGQDILLFDDSIVRNVSYGDMQPDLDRVRWALDAAQLGRVVAALPEREHTRIGRGGVQLSGGQCQLLAVARAFYRDAKIVLLDEPTSALDSVNESALLVSLRELIKGRSTILVSHRASTLALADRVHVLEHGTLRDEPLRTDRHTLVLEANE